jgi:hypothetical protein
MTATLTRWTRRRATGAAVTAAWVAVLTGCSVGSGTGVTAGDTAATSAPPVAPTARVVFRFTDRAVAATLVDTPAASRLAAMLPLTIELSDAWGQAKTAPLPHRISADGSARTLKPVPGGIYYWPDTATLAVYYDDLGQTVPPPGLVRLGVLDTDLEEVADLGRHATVQIEQATRAPS